ncbi:behavioral response to pain [Desmophyllum pertusum]|uniref:Behavioral response to pain n=1 Tax=Desmophyllum pertusum TaxID=174260 RepID=A0A9X0DD20_9CNID|nr:behavioral response to pain [Desmophyllum pertusum]
MTVLGFLIVCLGISLITATENTICTLDLGLLVDTTRSIEEENIPTVKAALQHLVQKFDISTDGTHVSFETFAAKSKLHNKFNNDTYHSKEAVLDLISDSINKLTQPTRLDFALKTAKEHMFTEESGLRPGVRSAMVLYTDGRSYPGSEDFFLDVVALKVIPSTWKFSKTFPD